MSTSDQPPVGQPWLGGATNRPPWETPDGETTQRIRPVPPPQPSPRTPQGAPPDLVGRSPHGDGVFRRVGRVITRAFSSSKQPRELAEVMAAVQTPITTGRRIAVASVRGGAGKTAVCALVGSVFATRRAEPVLAVDADPDSGSLAWRLGADSSMTLSGLAPALHTASGQDLSSVTRLLPRTSHGLWVVPGGSDDGRPQLARDVTRALSRLFAVAVLDCGTGMSTPATNAVLSDAHAVVITTPATPDGVRTTAAALARIPPGALHRVVVGLNTVDPHGRAALKRGAAEEVFGRLGIPVVPLPYDRHVAAAGPIDPGRLAEPTVAAASRLAAWSLHRAVQFP